MSAKQNKSQRFFVVNIIVVVIIGIIAAIAIPNLIASRRAANEGSSVSALRVLHSAQAAYNNGPGSGEYAGTTGTDDLSPLTQLLAAELIDPSLGLGTKSGYSYIGSRVPRPPRHRQFSFFGNR